MNTRAGQVIGSQFRLERLLASGGMGSVYMAEQVGVERTVAIKLMNARLTLDMPDALERFRREAKLAAQLNHPHVVQIYLFGQTDEGEFYLAMEYIDGQSLEELLRASGRLPEARVLRIAAQICDALCHAHHLGLVHRDLKPANIMVADRYGNRDYVKVLDFGIAKPAGPSAHSLTATDVIVGTPAYMAPEQARGQATDARTDLYSLGCVLYHLLAGEPPFDSQSPTDLIIRHATELPTPIRERFPKVVIQPRVEAIIDRCLQKEPALRYPSAAELKADIERALDDRPSSQRASYGAHGATPVLLRNGSPKAARADAPLAPSAAAGTVTTHISTPASESRDAELRSLAETARLERKRGYRVALTLGLLLVVGTLAIGYALYSTVSAAFSFS